jgi:hypothetical protein
VGAGIWTLTEPMAPRVPEGCVPVERRLNVDDASSAF